MKIMRPVEKVVTGKDAIETNDGAVLILNPNAAAKASNACLLFRQDIEDLGMDSAQKIIAHKSKVIMLAVKVCGIDEHHVHETGWHILRRQPQSFRETAERAYRLPEKPLPRFFTIAIRLKGLIEIDPAQDVLVRHRDSPQFSIGLEVLNICLHYGNALSQFAGHLFLLHAGPIDQSRLLRSRRSEGHNMRFLCLDR